MPLTLYWRVDEPMDRVWTIFVHVVDDAGILVAQNPSGPAAPPPLPNAALQPTTAVMIEYLPQIMFLMERVGLREHVEGDLLTWESTAFGWG